MATDLTSASLAEALSALGADPGRGLARKEAEARLRSIGPNEVTERRGHPSLDFLRKFWGVSAWMLELIIVISAVLGKYADLAVVTGLLVLNAVLGFAQERRAAAVVETLRRRLQVGARVLRDGAWGAAAARELVPGDIVRLRAGDIVPADVRLLTGGASLDQSALTGESAEVERGPGGVLPSGSVVRRGEGDGVVILTGARTLFGRTTELVQLARPRLHIEAVVAGVVRWLFLIVGALLGAVLAASLVRGAPLVEVLPLLLVLLMSAIPVALPVMFTVAMAVGAAELARRGVLVTRLSAAEDAATMDVLCVDKTGTITMNRLAVTGVIPLGGATETQVLLAGALASREANQDPIDLAFLAAARGRGGSGAAVPQAMLSFKPFDPQTRRTEAVVDLGGRRVRITKGAVRSVAEACGLSAHEADALEERARETGRAGQRTLAVAQGTEAGALAVIGLVTLHDPPRPEAAQLIARLRELGVGVKMLTGDALPVAAEIARAVGLTGIRRVAELRQAGSQSAEAAAVLAEAGGFAEVYPEDKYVVVQQLQAAGHVTGMTGDGVNDAPALRQAEVGIAVESATDVAKGAASVVLTEPGLTNIVALIEQGRAVYQRVLTWVVNKISRTILKAGFVAVAYLATGEFAVSAFGMLLLVFMTDFAKISLATDNVRWSQTPETWKIGGFVAVSAALGVAMVAEALLLLALCWSRFGLAASDAARASFSFLTLLAFAIFSILSARERRRFWASRPSRTLLAALAADATAGLVLTSIGLPGLAPLALPLVLGVFGYAALCCLLVNDALKCALYRRFVPSKGPDARRPAQAGSATTPDAAAPGISASTN